MTEGKFFHALHEIIKTFFCKEEHMIMCYVQSSSNFSLFTQTFQREFIICGRHHYAGPWICHLILKYLLYLLRMCSIDMNSIQKDIFEFTVVKLMLPWFTCAQILREWWIANISAYNAFEIIEKCADHFKICFL